MRVISLVPSITELLFDLGMDDDVVGLTKFCVHPRERWSSLPRIGGTKTVNHDRIASLKPDLIIANKEENTREDVERLRANYKVLVTDIRSVDDAFALFFDLGDVLERTQRAVELHDTLRGAWENAKGVAKGERTAYAIWRDPLMFAGSDTYISSVLEWFGWHNVIADARYPERSIDALAALKPQRLMLSSEPFPFSEKHREDYQVMLTDCAVECVDGELFSWYGSRMQHTPEYVKTRVASSDFKRP